MSRQQKDTVNSLIKVPPPIKAPPVFPDPIWVHFHIFAHISANNCPIFIP